MLAHSTFIHIQVRSVKIIKNFCIDLFISEQAVPLDDGATPLIPMSLHRLKLIIRYLVEKDTNHLGAVSEASMFRGHLAEIQPRLPQSAKDGRQCSRGGEVQKRGGEEEGCRG